MKELYHIYTGLEEPESEIHHLQHDEFPQAFSVPAEDPCPHCKGTGVLSSAADTAHPLAEHTRRDRLFTGTNLPPRYAHWTFASYLTLPLDPQQNQMAAQVETFVTLRLHNAYKGQKCSLYLYGPGGTGKTGLAIAALHTVGDAGQPALYLPTFQLFQIESESIAAVQRIHRGCADDEDWENERTGAKLLRLAQTVPWLVLDDLGAEYGSPWMISQLYAIVETRRLLNLFTIFTSNQDVQTLQEQWHRESRHRSDDAFRIIQRLGEDCLPVYLSGHTLRGQ